MVLMLINTLPSCVLCVQYTHSRIGDIMGDVDLFGLIVWNRVEILCNLFDSGVYLYGKMCVCASYTELSVPLH